MVVRSFLVLLLYLFVAVPINPAFAQSNDGFMAKASSLAIASQRETMVPASVTLAQAILETGWGQSPIGDAENYFGIKAAVKSDGTIDVGPIAEGWVWAWTKEWDGSRYVERRERFRKYRSMEDSFRDHAMLLSTAPRYKSAMQAVDDPREFARRIAAAGYATSPTYASDLIRLMDDENLYRYDLARDDAEILEQSDYVTVRTGEIFQIYFDLKNTGYGTWDPRQGYYLASANAHRFAAEPVQGLDLIVPPERVKRFAIPMVAPVQAGNFITAWQLKHGEAEVGPELHIRVTVTRPETGFDSRLIAAGAAAMAIVFGVLIWFKRGMRNE